MIHRWFIRNQCGEVFVQYFFSQMEMAIWRVLLLVFRIWCFSRSFKGPQLQWTDVVPTDPSRNLTHIVRSPTLRKLHPAWFNQRLSGEHCESTTGGGLVWYSGHQWDTLLDRIWDDPGLSVDSGEGRLGPVVIPWVVPFFPTIHSGKWKFFLESSTKHELILVVTITGKGDNPRESPILKMKACWWSRWHPRSENHPKNWVISGWACLFRNIQWVWKSFNKNLSWLQFNSSYTLWVVMWHFCWTTVIHMYDGLKFLCFPSHRS